MSYGVGCRHSLDLALPWCGRAAVATIGPLAWELLYATGVALKSKKKKKKKNNWDQINLKSFCSAPINKTKSQRQHTEREKITANHLSDKGPISKIFIYRERDSYQNFRITAKQKSTIDTQTNKKNQLKYNAKGCHQTTRGENKRRKEEKTATKTNPKQLIKWQ